MITIPDIATLVPQKHRLSGGGDIYCFPGATEFVKLDVVFEAGSMYQPQSTCATAALKLATKATAGMDSSSLAEFLDYRGVIVDSTITPMQAVLTVYMLRRHAAEVLPVVADMLKRPAFAPADFVVWQSQRRQELATLEQRTSHVARRMFYQTLFGENHPLGRYAVASDVDKLSLDTVRGYFRDRFHLENSMIVVSGKTDGELDDIIDTHFGTAGPMRLMTPVALTMPEKQTAPQTIHTCMPDAVQTSLRIGRVLPLRWDEPDYAGFLILTTALGGYFGSRLMQNIREDKGYTYGINARTQLYRGVIVFNIMADVAGGMADAAVHEVMRELQRLCDEPMGEDELQLVKTVLAGDFLRSVDGVFELSSRYCDMVGASITEKLTDNIRAAINEATAGQLQELAQRLLKCEDMTVCLAGV